METLLDARKALMDSWAMIRNETLEVLGSELHYQAMIYHALRIAGKVPYTQLGMNVKMWIEEPVTELFQQYDRQKHPAYQGGFEPIPDIVLFRSSIQGDWRRRNYEKTLQEMLMAIEVKASERQDGRLIYSEIQRDIEKLAAHREEARARGNDFAPVMLIIDSAPEAGEQMTESSLKAARISAEESDVGFMYLSRHRDIVYLNF